MWRQSLLWVLVGYLAAFSWSSLLCPKANSCVVVQGPAFYPQATDFCEQNYTIVGFNSSDSIFTLAGHAGAVFDFLGNITYLSGFVSPQYPEVDLVPNWSWNIPSGEYLTGYHWQTTNVSLYGGQYLGMGNTVYFWTNAGSESFTVSTQPASEANGIYNFNARPGEEIVGFWGCYGITKAELGSMYPMIRMPVAVCTCAPFGNCSQTQTYEGLACVNVTPTVVVQGPAFYPPPHFNCPYNYTVMSPVETDRLVTLAGSYSVSFAIIGNFTYQSGYITPQYSTYRNVTWTWDIPAGEYLTSYTWTTLNDQFYGGQFAGEPAYVSFATNAGTLSPLYGYNNAINATYNFTARPGEEIVGFWGCYSAEGSPVDTMYPMIRKPVAQCSCSKTQNCVQTYNGAECVDIPGVTTAAITTAAITTSAVTTVVETTGAATTQGASVTDGQISACSNTVISFSVIAGAVLTVFAGWTA